MNKKASQLVVVNVVKSVLFALLLIVVLVAIANWWNTYRSQGIFPAVRSVNAIVKASNNLEETNNLQITRKVSIQTGEYYIISFNENPELCYDKLEKGNNCLCVCNSQDCSSAYQNPGKYCRMLSKKSTINLGPSEDILTYELRLEKDIILISPA